MAAVWQVQEAKSRLSELMDRALDEGPQIITRHGKPVVKVVAADAPPDAADSDDDFLEFLVSIPKSGLDEGLPRMPRRNRRRPLFGDE
ncbi:type II toxin-antitoxin system Phd/YefM family antitoxin [Caenimonas aquaedulcis]|uniref:Antitoxin n=1 Tax=Caenimonas aquaedulcis TaxID=2793270 RepID=A0A931MFV0_9BURK|nr:type II toxin-antitoxin system Phd/YefM family antitoxin [Caenimonas aquaedulcis]MBG9387289.1 type II toxin-antitoxin system Phd/YefM family antitoxin [Caenimonas aquaedulcis]